MAFGPSAATGSNAFYSQQYASAVELLSQQMASKLEASCTPMSAVGKSATAVNFIDSFEADERTALYDTMVLATASHTRPWVYPKHFDKAIPFDSIEQMQMNANPQSEYVAGIVAALNRKKDAEIIRAFFASRNTGESGSTADTFDSTNYGVGVSVGGTTSGLNVQKLQKVLQLARIAEVDTANDPLTIVISPKQETNMMDEIEATSGDFTRKAILDAGTIVGSGFMGFNWIISNYLGTDGSSYRMVPVYAKSGMCFATWDGGTKTTVDQRVDLRGKPWQAYGETHCGAVRRDAKKVFQILCAES